MTAAAAAAAKATGFSMRSFSPAAAARVALLKHVIINATVWVLSIISEAEMLFVEVCGRQMCLSALAHSLAVKAAAKT